MNKDELMVNSQKKIVAPSNSSNTSPSQNTTVSPITHSKTTTATKLQITPMSPLNIQSLKNGFIDQPSQHKPNGHILLQPAYGSKPIPNNHVGITPSLPPLTTNHAQPNALFQTSNITKLTNNEIQSSKDLDSKFLHQIIGNGFKAPSADKTLDVRNTVVKKAPGGTVQITYKNMINHSPQASNNNNLPQSNPIYILPKPVNGIGQQFGIQQQAATYHSIATSATLSNQQLIQHSMIAQPISNTINTTQTSSNKTDTSVYLIDSSHDTNQSNPITSATPTWMPNLNHQSNTFQSISIESMEFQNDHSILFSTQQNDDLSNTVDLNPFNGIDIDLSCFDTEPFDALNQLYPSGNDHQNFHDQNFDTNTDLCNEETAQNFNSTVISSINIDPITSTENLNTNTTSQDEIPMNIDSNIDSNVTDHFLSQQHNQATSQTEPRINDKQLTDKQQKEENNELKNIIDVSPELAVCTGGVKIILIGSWNAKDARYQCQFGSCCVDAELIQNGVLRCFSPKHKPGAVRLSVLCNSKTLSEEVDFTFVESSEKNWTEKIDHDEWLSISETTLADLLVKRISFISDMVTGDETNAARAFNRDALDPTLVEDKLIDVCKSLMSQTVDIDFDYKIERTMTVLHLASALGYLKLIQLLMNWVESNPNKIIQVEACPTCVDQFSLVPIMWASAKGHFTTTCVLHQWAESTIELKDACGCTSLSLAMESGHESLVEYLGRLIKKSTISRENSMNQEQFSSSLSTSFGNPGSVSSTSTSISNVDDSSPRTLGKTLAFIQSMLNEQMDDLNHAEDEEDDDASLFAAHNEFVNTRQRSITDESVASTSQHSPASPAQNALQSPFNRQMRETAEFCEFFYKAKKIEKDFAELTLTDQEQEELYRAANVIQTAYKAYKERRKQRDQEFSSATLIQSYYRRYKQYAAFKKMQKGAVLIQNQYRAHREKSKKKYEAASLIQTNWRRYRQRKCTKSEANKLEQQASRRVNRYLQQTTKRFSREFPEEFNAPSTSSQIIDIDFGPNS